jgi:predicted ATPase
MESLTKRRLAMIAVWDDEHVKALLHFPRFPVRLIQQEPWQSWIGKRGGLKSIHAYLQSYPFPPTHRRILDVVLSNPESVADVYADRLNISRSTYFYQLRELVPAIAQALNHWELYSESVLETNSPLQPHLPAALTSLVGVENTIQTLIRLFSRPDVRLLTLLGPGGIGKTRLSIEIARRLSREACFVDLSALRDPSRIAAVIAQNLGIKDKTVSALKVALHNCEFLLILDNFEQILPAGAFVADLLAASPQLKIIITSRAALHIYGEHEFLIPPLAIADIESVKGQQLWAQSPAVALFVQRAQAVNPNFSLNNENVEAVTELCQRMDGLPLAIELAAYQVKYFSPQAMLTCISSNRLSFLSQGPKRMPPHQQTMRAMLDWSFELLSPEMRMFFCQLSVFPGSFTVSKARSLCRSKNVQEELIALVDQSLLEQHPCVGEDDPQFQMLSIVREYASERLNDLAGPLSRG